MKAFRLEQYRVKGHPANYQIDSNSGFFQIPHYRVHGYEIRCLFSDGLGWEHCSVTVAPLNKNATRCPTWEEMCHVKDLFWGEDEVVIQYHPAKKDYVSMHPYCLHLWKPIDVVLPTPDPLMVGINLK